MDEKKELIEVLKVVKDFVQYTENSPIGKLMHKYSADLESKPKQELE